MRAKTSHWLLAAALFLFFAVFLIWPIVQVVGMAFASHGHFTTEYFGLVFRDPVLVQGLLNSLMLAVAVTFLCLVIALPLAVWSVRYEFPGRAVFSGLVLVPLILPPFVGAIGMREILARFGPLTVIASTFVGPLPLGIDWLGKLRFLGVIVVEALGLYPIMLLNIQAALANMDPAMEMAASNMGASRWTVFRKITLPLLRPGLFAGCTLVLIWSFTELGTPLMFDLNTVTPVQVFWQITEVSDNPMPFALVVVMLVASAALYLIGKAVFGRGFEASTVKASTASASHRLKGWKGWLVTGGFAGVAALALLPHIAVILTSLSATGAWYKAVIPRHFTASHYLDALRDPLAMPSVGNSVYYAGIATLFGIIVGLGVAIIVVRSKVPGRGLLDSLSMLPLAVPGLVLAFGYLSISVGLKQRFGKETPWWLDVQQWPVVFLIAAYAARRLPYVVRSAVAGLEQTPQDLELAAANLGASRWRVLGRITVPLILANLIAGGAAGVCLCHAGGQRLADSGAADGLLPDHQGHLGIERAAGGWALHCKRRWVFGPWCCWD